METNELNIYVYALLIKLNENVFIFINYFLFIFIYSVNRIINKMCLLIILQYSQYSVI